MGEYEEGEWQAELEQLFLSRLARLVKWRRWWDATKRPVPELLEYAVHSTYLDCVRLGLQAEARQLLGLADGQEGGRS